MWIKVFCENWELLVQTPLRARPGIGAISVFVAPNNLEIEIRITKTLC